MRRIFFMILCISLTISIAFPQTKKKTKFIFEFQGGTSISNFISSAAPVKYFHNSDESFPTGSISGYVPFNSASGSFDITSAPYYFDYKNDFLIKNRSGYNLDLYIKYPIINNNIFLEGGIGIEQKGIHHYEENSSIEKDPLYGKIIVKSTLKSYIDNAYMTFYLLLNKCFNNGLGFDFGVYSGILIKSARQGFVEKLVYDTLNTQIGRSYVTLYTKTNTHKIDYGLSSEISYKYPVTRMLSLSLNCRLNVGLAKLDNKYNNEYVYQDIPYYYGGGYMLQFGNYHGYNSKSKNINLLINAGLTLQLDKPDINKP